MRLSNTHGFAALLALPFHVTAQNANADATVQDTLSDCLLEGYPLLSFEKYAQPLITTVGPNQISHARELRTADYRLVVKPNVDTIYSTAIFDLSHFDLVVNVPAFLESFVLFSYYDPYGDNFANIGAGNYRAAGQYRLTKSSMSNADVQAEVPANPDSPPYVATITSPATYGVLLIRLLVNATNLDAVHDYQDAIFLQNVTRAESRTARPYLSDLPVPDSSLTPAENVIRLYSAFTAADSPSTESTAATSCVAGSTADLAQANASAIQTAMEAADAASTRLNNGWARPNASLIGNYGTNYGFRTAMALAGYLALTSPEAVYPNWGNGSSDAASVGDSYPLGPDESVLYTFSGKPPLQDGGFWSLTAYEDDYLIPNSRDVYALGDRSNLTYSNGAPVYGGNASNTDGTFQILIQPANVAPPANWTSNWLPGPPNGGNYSAILRWFGAEEALLDGSYQYPVVTRQPAIRGNSNSTSTGGNGTGTGSGVSPSRTQVPYTGAGNSMVGDSTLIASAALLVLAFSVMY